MKLESVKLRCLSQKGAWEDFPFGSEVLVVKVADKMFALIAYQENPIKISLKCDPLIAQDLRKKYASVTPGYHLNKRHWNTIILDDTIPLEEINEMIHQSYQLVYRSLKKADRQRIAQL